MSEKWQNEIMGMRTCIHIHVHVHVHVVHNRVIQCSGNCIVYTWIAIPIH